MGGRWRNVSGANPKPRRWSAELVRTIAGAVAAAHAQGVVHRDLKPRNIIFTADGTPKITDYGLAKLLNEDRGLTVTGQSPGTPSYMAPEQAGASRYAVGPATDIYALGAILYELLTGRPPFRGVSVGDTLELIRTQEPVPPSRLQPKIPRPLETVCLKCLEKDPDRRYRSPGVGRRFETIPRRQADHRPAGRQARAALPLGPTKTRRCNPRGVTRTRHRCRLPDRDTLLA